jgi:hypothetical protein
VQITNCSVQPVNSKRYAEMGLDYAKAYVTWYVPADVLGVGRDVSGDQIEWNGCRYQCQSDWDWFGQDGWKEVLCIRV